MSVNLLLSVDKLDHHREGERDVLFQAIGIEPVSVVVPGVQLDVLEPEVFEAIQGFVEDLVCARHVSLETEEDIAQR